MLFIRKGHEQPGAVTRPLAWLPGHVQVEVAGESFHLAAIERAVTRSSPGSAATAVLVPETDNPHDVNAVAVYVNEEHVGFLPRGTALRTHPALAAFSRRFEGQLVSCPAEIRCWNEGVPQVVLWLDPSALGLQPEAFEADPRRSETLPELLRRLDQPEPRMDGADHQARSDLTAGDHLRQRLLQSAEAHGDMVCVAALTGRAGLDAEKAGDLSAAVGLWRRAVSAGSTDEKVAEKLSVWLVRQREYDEAAGVLRQALAIGPRSANLAERMERRLARCERELARGAG